MSDYTRVHEELAKGTTPELLCATCPWDRLCVTPPAVSRQEIDRHLADAEQKDRVRDPHGVGLPVHTIMTAVAYGGRDQMGALCPVFALRLHSPDGRELADGVRTLMRGETAGG